MYVDDPGDVVIEDPNAGFDVVYAAITYSMVANVEKLVLTGGADLNGTGNALANQIYGTTGRNVLDGGGGNDTLYGGGGSDVFILRPGGGQDTVMDFIQGDRVNLSSFGAGAAQVAVTRVGSGTLLTLPTGDSMTLAGVTQGGMQGGLYVW